MRNKISPLSLEKAAQCWCYPTTSHKKMDIDLCLAFADTLDKIWEQPWLGNATTKELLDEIAARVDLEYRTINERNTQGSSNQSSLGNGKPQV
jgi:hypothetical protein